MKNIMTDIDCYPDKAQYFPGETVKILLEKGNIEDITEIIIKISELDKIVFEGSIREAELLRNKIIYPIELKLPAGNYGVDVFVIQDDVRKEVHTAFDIVDSYTTSIRYGFLTDFEEEDKLDRSDINYAVKLHLNALQFYDWMYRHDQLVSDTEEYQEPMGRGISQQTLVNKINACKESGIRAFAYGAVYAASKEAYARHPEWAFYKKNQETLTFADWLIFMDTSDNSPWCKHIIEEYSRAIAKLGFQGIQMDTYGFPKYAWNSKQERISLADTFSEMINKAKAAVNAVDEKAGVIFNAVNNWPIEKIARSEQDAVYIEVWPPHVTYHHLYSLIREAKYLGGKNVVLAAYIEAFKDTKTLEDVQAAETSYLLTNAVIQASGGTQIVLGETNGLLRDSYFVNYEVLREEFLPVVKSYCDFTVRYGKLLFDNQAMDISMTAAGGINTDILFSVPEDNKIRFSSCGEPGKVWSIIRETKQFMTIQLINLSDENEFWNQPKYQRPAEIRNIQMDILLDADVKAIYYATPDDGSCTPIRLDYRTVQKDNGQRIVLEIPQLDIWDLIWIELM